MSEKQPLTRYSDLPPGYDPAEPWKLDLVPERRELAESLTAYFKAGAKPFVVAVNAGWGTGKSLFLRMWNDALDELLEEEVEGWRQGTHALPPEELLLALCDILEGRKAPDDVEERHSFSPKMRGLFC